MSEDETGEANEEQGAKKRGRVSSPGVDPNLPRADGERVSRNGGLVFVGIVLSLIGLAIGLQFAMG